MKAKFTNKKIRASSPQVLSQASCDFEKNLRASSPQVLSQQVVTSSKKRWSLVSIHTIDHL